MITFISQVLRKSESRLGVVEAGTGTGKTVAYCIPALLEARRLNKKLVIVTSTVLLQQQLMNGELAQLAEVLSPGIRFGIAKGRQRYVCLDLLDKHATHTPDAKIDLFGEDMPQEEDRKLATRLLDQFDTEAWHGDMDTLAVEANARQRRAFTTNYLGCHRNSCEFSKPCPYYRARSQISELDVIVTNYSLLMAAEQDGIDLLPDPTDCIYVFDEAHKLADIVMSSHSSMAGVKATEDLMNSIESFINQFVSNSDEGHPLDLPQQDLLRSITEIRPKLKRLDERIARVVESNFVERVDSESRWRYPNGVVDDDTRERMVDVTSTLSATLATLEKLREIVDQARQDLAMWIDTDLLGRAARRLTELQTAATDVKVLFDNWSAPKPRPAARWISRDDKDGFKLHCVPVAIGEILQETIWSRAYGVICTSASIYTSNGFDHFKRDVGLDSVDAPEKRIASPFDFRNRVRFQVVDLGFDRPGGKEFNIAAANALPKLLNGSQSGLVIFTSRADMHEVHELLSTNFKTVCRKQDDESVVVTLNRHKQAIENGERSFIFGLDSYREGVDLPGDLCQHVVVMRIPFRVPTDPVIKTRKELMGLHGADAFFSFDIPDASLRLYQTCGRLLRNESDSGSITVLDRRLVMSGYHKALQEPLPDYDIQFVSKETAPRASRRATP